MSFDRRVERNPRNSNLAYLQCRGERNRGAERLRQRIAAGEEITEPNRTDIPEEMVESNVNQEIFDSDNVEVQNQEISSGVETVVKNIVEREKKRDTQISNAELLSQLAREQGGQKQNIGNEDIFLDKYSEEVQEEIRDRMEQQELSDEVVDQETLQILRNLQDIENGDQDSDVSDEIPRIN